MVKSSFRKETKDRITEGWNTIYIIIIFVISIAIFANARGLPREFLSDIDSAPLLPRRPRARNRVFKIPSVRIESKAELCYAPAALCHNAASSKVAIEKWYRGAARNWSSINPEKANAKKMPRFLGQRRPTRSRFARPSCERTRE